MSAARRYETDQARARAALLLTCPHPVSDEVVQLLLGSFQGDGECEVLFGDRVRSPVPVRANDQVPRIAVVGAFALECPFCSLERACCQGRGTWFSVGTCTVPETLPAVSPDGVLPRRARPT